MHKVQVGCADSNSRFVMTRAAVQSQASSKVARMNTGRVRRRRQIDDKCLDLRTGIVRSTGKASFFSVRVTALMAMVHPTRQSGASDDRLFRVLRPDANRIVRGRCSAMAHTIALDGSSIRRYEHCRTDAGLDDVVAAVVLVADAVEGLHVHGVGNSDGSGCQAAGEGSKTGRKKPLANGRAQVGALPPSPGLAFRPRRRFSRRFATGRAKSCPRPYLRPPQLHGHGKRPWNTVGDRLWERGQGLFTTMPAKQSARLLPPPHNQGRGGRRRDHRGQGRCWHWHHCRQPHWVTEGTMLWGSRQGTARREVSFPKESV